MCPRRRRTPPSCSSYFSGGRALASRRRRSRQMRHHASRRWSTPSSSSGARARPARRRNVIHRHRHRETERPRDRETERPREEETSSIDTARRHRARRVERRARESGHGRRVRLHDGDAAPAVRRADEDEDSEPAPRASRRVAYEAARVPERRVARVRGIRAEARVPGTSRSPSARARRDARLRLPLNRKPPRGRASDARGMVAVPRALGVKRGVRP